MIIIQMQNIYKSFEAQICEAWICYKYLELCMISHMDYIAVEYKMLALKVEVWID